MNSAEMPTGCRNDPACSVGAQRRRRRRPEAPDVEAPEPQGPAQADAEGGPQQSKRYRQRTGE